jgi:phosphoglycerate kinase
MKTIKELKNISGKKVLLRADFNVPIKNGKITSTFRIEKTIPTISFLQKKGAKVIIISHLGDKGEESLEIVAKEIKKHVKGFKFIPTPILSDETEEAIKSMKKGEVILLENIRREEGEKKNFPSFARALSRYGDIYVNDAFSVCHREHASVVGITKHIPGYAGLQLMEEIDNLSKVFVPKHPFLFILGGAKFETKIPLVKKFLRLADTVFIGGAIANDFLKAKGYEVGNSLVGEENFQIPLFLKNKKLILPEDVIVSDGTKKRTVSVKEVLPNETILDVGPNTIGKIKKIASESKLILWNGPLGKYEDGFDGSSSDLLKEIAKSKATSIIGGGDSVALVNKLKLGNKISFLSTGGGASLDFLAKGILPGIRGLN